MQHPLVPVPSSAVQSGALLGLGICPRHGLPMVRSKKRSYYTETPVWAYLLVIVSLLIAVIFILATRKTVTGLVPDCATCVSDQKKRTQTVLGLWGASLLLFCVGVGVNSGGLAVMGFLVMVVALIASFAIPRKWQQGQVTKDGGWVELGAPAPAFTAAVHQAMSQAAPPQQISGYYSPGVTDAR